MCEQIVIQDIKWKMKDILSFERINFKAPVSHSTPKATSLHRFASLPMKGVCQNELSVSLGDS